MTPLGTVYFGASLSGLFGVVTFLPLVAAAVRRLRDAGRHWTELLWLLSPIAGSIVVIGGTQTVAAASVARRQPRRLLLSAVGGAGMLIWIFVELAVISEYSWLQSLYFALGEAELAAVLVPMGSLRPASGIAGRLALPRDAAPSQS